MSSFRAIKFFSKLSGTLYNCLNVLLKSFTLYYSLFLDGYHGVVLRRSRWLHGHRQPFVGARFHCRLLQHSKLYRSEEYRVARWNGNVRQFLVAIAGRRYPTFCRVPVRSPRCCWGTDWKRRQSERLHEGELVWLDFYDKECRLSNVEELFLTYS